MIKDWKIVLVLVLGTLISIVGFRYRIRQYDQIPYVNQSFDEVGYLWLGKSLLTTGIPANWSALNFYSQYQNIDTERVIDFNIAVDGKSPSLSSWHTFKKPTVKSFEGAFDNNYISQFLIVQPYLDNPPLTGVIFALVDSGKSMAVNSIKNIRLVPIFLLSMTILTVFVLGYRLMGFSVGLISALIYSFGPGFIVSSRMALPENLISALLPLSLLVFHYYQNLKKRRLLLVLCTFCFIAIWLKISGVIIPLILILISFEGKMFRTGWAIALSAVLGFSSYVVYCLMYSPSLFVQMMSTQSTRMFSGPAGMLSKMLHPEIPAAFFDGWIILGYISILGIIILARKKRALNYLSLSFAGFLIFFTMFGGLNFPWYQFIIYPILALSLGVIVDHFLVRPKFEFNLLFFLVVLSTLLQYSQFTNSWINYLNTYRFLLAALVLSSLAGWFFQKYRKLLLRISLVAMLLLSFYLGTRIINNFGYLWPLLMQNMINII